ncbi:MAG: 50S ribosomal protein L33 [Gammaproteobacteria bacterium]|nr:50S ribosomal protein L33 [Gammaproteobacteria bacterium]
MRDKIKMASTGTTKSGQKTGTFRVTTKNKRTMTEKFKKKYYDPRAYNPETGKTGMHVMFEEGKL